MPLGSPDVSLDLQGSWSAELDGALGWEYDSSTHQYFPTTFPGMTSGYQFLQVPNLDVSLDLLNRYFFQASFADNTGSGQTQSANLPADLNTIVMGYNGKPGEFVNTVRIGNAEADFAPLGFLSFPEQPQTSIGAAATFSTDNARYQAMLRYEPTSLHKKTFVGHMEVTETRIDPSSYVQGQYFVLPDDDIKNVTVYIEATNTSGTVKGGDNHWYRVAGAADVVVSEKDGTLYFREPLVGRALVFYTKNGTNVGDETFDSSFFPTGSTWPTYTRTDVTISGSKSLLIYDPGTFSPFQSDNVYSVSSADIGDGSQISASIVGIGEGGLSSSPAQASAGSSAAILPSLGGTALTVKVDTTAKTMTVLGQASSSSFGDPRALATRFPLASIGSLEAAYGTGPGNTQTDTGNQILARIMTPVQSYSLDPNIVPGSVAVLQNGQSVSDFTTDATNGIISFSAPVADDDVLIVTYRTATTTTPGGDVLFGIGGTFDLLPGLTLDAGAGMRWSIFSGNYSTQEGTNLGSAVVGAGLHYAAGSDTKITADLQAGLSIASPDTTGTFLLFGMEGAGQGVPMAEGSMYPSSAPDDTDEPLTGAPTLLDRGKLFYKDYHSYSVASATLEPLSWSPPSDQSYSYSAGNPVGPYPVYDPTEGTVMVMDYSMTSSQNWVGAQVPLPGAPEDLTGAQSIDFDVKTSDASSFASGDLLAYLQIGAVSEDLDGNGTLDSASSVANNVFPFKPGSTAYVTGGGAPPGNPAGTATTGTTLRSEDTNGNGLLDLENPQLVATLPVTIKSTTSWQTVSVSLTDPDVRQQLSHANAVRIILVNKVGGTVAGVFQVGSLSISGAPFHTSGTGASGVTAAETPDPNAGSKSLVERYPEVSTVFHSGGTTQKVLTITADNENWTLTGYPEPVGLGSYKNVVLYETAKSLSPSAGDTLDVDLLDSSSRGVKIKIPLSNDGAWHKIVADLDSRTLSIDGAASSGTVTVTSRAAEIEKTTISVSGATSGGTIAIDEISLQDAGLVASAGATFNASLSHPGTLWSVGGVPIVSDLTLSEQSSLTGPAFAAGFQTFPDAASASSFTRLTAKLPVVSVDTSFGVTQTGDATTLSGSHALDIPIGPVDLDDSYSQSSDGTDETFSRASSAALSMPPLLTLSLTSSATSLATGLNQTVGATVGTHPVSAVSLTTKASLGSVSPAFEPYSPSYFANWVDAYRLLVPLQGASSLRTAALSSELSATLIGPLAPPVGSSGGAVPAVNTTSLGIDLTPQGSVSSDPTGGRSQTSIAALALSIPLTLPIGLQVTPSYSRAWSTTAGARENDTYGADFSTYFGQLDRAHYLFDTVPFQELFQSSLVDAFAEETSNANTATYSPTASIAFDRNAGSSVADLVVPVHVALTLSRALARQADTVTDGDTWELNVRTDALNLFGAQGVRRIFTFYNTEEIAGSLDIKVAPTATTTVIQNLVDLYLSNQRQITLNHRLSLSWSTTDTVNDAVTATYDYPVPLPAAFSLPYIPADFQNGRYLENTESLTVTSAPDVISNSLQLAFEHDTSLVLPNHGKITASAGIGLQENQTSATTRVYLGGIEASVSADFVF